jgi:hypothetical protein
MKRNLRFAVAALLAAVAWLPGGMQAQAPYVPQKTDFGGTAISDLNSFTPSSSDYTLQVEGTVGTAIVVNGGSYNYTPTTSGTVRFVYYKGNLYVYEGSTYMKTLTSGTATVVYPSITSSTVTTSTDELLSNPGFETVGTTITTDKYNFGDPWKTNVTCAAFGIRIGVKNSEKVVVWRGSENSNYFTQSLTSIKANTNYKVQMEQVDGGNATATFNVGLGSTAGGIDYVSSTVVLGNGLNGEKTATFKTPSTIASTVYFSFKNTSTNTASAGSDPVTQLSYISLVEGSIPISGVNSATYLEGTAYAPESTLESGKYLDATNQITNPSFETNSLTGWTQYGSNAMSVAKNSNFAGKVGTYFIEKWTASTVASQKTLADCGVYQSLTSLPSGYYTLSAIAHCVQQSDNSAATGALLYAGTIDNATSVGYDYNYSIVSPEVTDGNLEIGYKMINTTGNWSAIDNFTLKYYTTELSAYQAILTDRLADASALLNNATYVNITGKERTDLSTAITNASTTPTTVADCKTLLTALQSAHIAFANALVSYNAWAAQLTSFPAANYTATQYPYASATKLAAVVTAASFVVTSTSTASEVAAATTTYLKALREAVESNGLAECYSWTTNYTSSITNAKDQTATTGWTIANTCKVGNKTGEPYTLSDGTQSKGYFDTDNWGSAWTLKATQTLSNMPVGTYLFSVMSRCSTNLTSYQLSGNGTTTDMLRKGNSGELFGNGWNDNNVKFTQTTAGDMTLAVTGEALASSWASFSNMRLVRISKDISDASDFSNAEQYTADVVLNRSLKASVWNTICLPFEVSSANLETVFGTGAKVAKFSGVTVSDEGNTKINFTTTDNSIAANQPCLINVPTEGNAWLIQGATVGTGTPSTVSNTGSNTTANLSVTVDMRGNYESLTDVKTAATTAAGSSALPYIVSNGNLYLVDVSTMNLKPFRAYFTVSSTTGGSVKGLDITIDGETTDIEGINMNEQAVSGNIYNLNGQMVRKNASTMEGLQKGVYIVNGKKQIVK